MKTKMDRLEREIEKVDGKYVTFPHFEAVVEPLRKAMGDMQKDIKKILSLVGGGDQRRKHQDED